MAHEINTVPSHTGEELLDQITASAPKATSLCRGRGGVRGAIADAVELY